ncbi:MAG: hypothetical protein V1875_02825 [Candidatus Altiarchaeota archaeon]
MGKVSSLRKDLLTVFLLAAGFRLLLNIAFYAVWGPHSVNHLELWLYYAVAAGINSTAQGDADPTTWFFGLMGSFFEGDALFYAVGLSSVILTSIASVFVCLIGREVYGGRAGLFSGLIYAFLNQTLSLSMVGFTHDHLMMPLALAVLFLVIWALKAKGMLRWAYAVSASVLFFLGTKIHVGMYVTLAVVGIVLASRIVAGYRKYVLYFTVLLAAGILLGGSCILPRVVDLEIGRLPQGRLGSADVVPVSASGLWLKYSLLLVFIPWGLYAAYRRREFIAISYSLIGFVFGLVMERGTRFLDIGVALLVAYALVEWTGKDRRLILALSALSAVVVLVLSLPIPYQAFFIVSLIALVWIVCYSRYDAAKVLALLCLVGCVLASASLFLSEDHVVAEAEYFLYSNTLRGLEPGSVLASWDRGFMIDALSGMRAVSSPAYIDYLAHEALWLPQEQAHRLLRSRGVDYVVLADSQYNELVYKGAPYYLLKGGMALTPKDIPPISLSNYLAIHALRYGQANPSYFTAVAVADDPVGGNRIMVYRLTDSGGDNGTLVSIIAENNEDRTLTANVELEVLRFPGGKKPVPEYGPPMASLLEAGDNLRCFARTSAGMGFLGSLSVLLFSWRRERSMVRRYLPYLVVLLVACGMVYSLLGSCCQGEQTIERSGSGMEVVHKTFQAEFPPSKLTEASFDAGDVGDIYGCSVTINGGQPAGFVGRVAFMALCDEVDEEAKILLVDSNASQTYGKMAIEDERTVKLRLTKGQEKPVDYAFQRKNPGHVYAVGFGKSQCVAAVAEGSVEPRPSGVELRHAFCGRATDLRDYERIT